ncbi:MAG: class I SAM-dependent methyltransferase [Candidatus Omnitrophota bacterium]
MKKYRLIVNIIILMLIPALLITGPAWSAVIDSPSTYPGERADMLSPQITIHLEAFQKVCFDYMSFLRQNDSSFEKMAEEIAVKLGTDKASLSWLGKDELVIIERILKNSGKNKVRTRYDSPEAIIRELKSFLTDKKLQQALSAAGIWHAWRKDIFNILENIIMTLSEASIAAAVRELNAFLTDSKIIQILSSKNSFWHGKSYKIISCLKHISVNAHSWISASVAALKEFILNPEIAFALSQVPPWRNEHPRILQAVENIAANDQDSISSSLRALKDLLVDKKISYALTKGFYRKHAGQLYGILENISNYAAGDISSALRALKQFVSDNDGKIEKILQTEGIWDKGEGGYFACMILKEISINAKGCTSSSINGFRKFLVDDQVAAAFSPGHFWHDKREFVRMILKAIAGQQQVPLADHFYRFGAFLHNKKIQELLSQKNFWLNKDKSIYGLIKNIATYAHSSIGDALGALETFILDEELKHLFSSDATARERAFIMLNHISQTNGVFIPQVLRAFHKRLKKKMQAQAAGDERTIKQKVNELLAWATVADKNYVSKWEKIKNSIEDESVICILHLGNYDARIDNVKVWMNPSPEYMQIRGKIFSLADGGNISGLLVEIIKSLPGNKVEIVLPASAIPAPRSRDNWEEDWKETIYHKVVYSSIYDEAIREVETIISGFFQAETDVALVDIGGGDGEFIELLNRFIKTRSAKRDPAYWLIDDSAKSIKKAQKRLADIPRCTIVKDNIFSLSSIIQNNLISPQIITALGVINAHVMDKNQALFVAQQAYEQLQAGGYFIVSGKTFSLVSAAEFRRMGFEVLKMSIPQNIDSADECRQLYVLRKPIVKTETAQLPMIIMTDKNGFLDFEADDVISIFQKTNNITGKREAMAIVELKEHNLDKIQAHFKKNGVDVQPRPEDWQDEYWRKKTHYYEFFSYYTEKTRIYRNMIIFIAISEKGIVEGFIMAGYAKDNKYKLGSEGIKYDDYTFCGTSTQVAPWNLTVNGLDDAKDEVVSLQKAKFSGIGTDLSAALIDYAFKIRDNRKIEDNLVLRTGVPDTWRGVRHAQYLTRYNGPEYGAVELRRNFYLPARSALKFKIYNLLKFYCQKPYAAREIWEFSGLKSWGYPLAYLYDGETGLLDEMVKDEKEENRIYEVIGKKGEIAFTADFSPRLTEYLYHTLLPGGIPVFEEDAVDMEFARDITLSLITKKDVYYSSLLSGVFVSNIFVRKGEKLLDFGTGTGVIAISAIKRGAGYVLALDDHDASVALAKRNREKFAIDPKIMEVIKSDGYRNVPQDKKFNTIVSFPPVPPAGNVDKNDTRLYDQYGEFIKMILAGAKGRLFPAGKVIIMYPDNPAAIENIKRLGAKYGLIITRRVKWGTEDDLQRSYRKSEFAKVGIAEADSMRADIAKEGFYTWSVFTFELIEDFKVYSKTSPFREDKSILPVRNSLGYSFGEAKKRLETKYPEQEMEIWDFKKDEKRKIDIWALVESYLDRDAWEFYSDEDFEESKRIAQLGDKDLRAEVNMFLAERPPFVSPDRLQWLLDEYMGIEEIFGLKLCIREPDEALICDVYKQVSKSSNYPEAEVEKYRQRVEYLKKYNRYLREIIYRWNLPNRPSSEQLELPRKTGLVSPVTPGLSHFSLISEEYSYYAVNQAI